MKESEEKVAAFSREREILFKQRDSALQEAHLWRSELAKAREHAVLMEAAVVRAEERARVSQADAEARLKDAAEKSIACCKRKRGSSSIYECFAVSSSKVSQADVVTTLFLILQTLACSYMVIFTLSKFPELCMLFLVS